MENSINKDFLLTNALNSATALKGLLEQEFEALKSQNIADFEKLQPKKTEIISLLSNPELSNIVKNNASIELTKSTLGIWDNLTKIISECKDLHRRNEIFINRKLESIKGALNTIQAPLTLSIACCQVVTQQKFFHYFTGHLNRLLWQSSSHQNQ